MLVHTTDQAAAHMEAQDAITVSNMDPPCSGWSFAVGGASNLYSTTLGTSIILLTQFRFAHTCIYGTVDPH